MGHEIKQVKSTAEIAACWDAVYALRPHLVQENYVAQVQQMMEEEGFRMICIEENGKVVAFSGYRPMHTLFAGRTFYIDDLSTLPEARGKGCGGALLGYIHEEAKKEGRVAVYLDSGYQRNDAHRLYLNKGYKLASHHFGLNLK